MLIPAYGITSCPGDTLQAYNIFVDGEETDCTTSNTPTTLNCSTLRDALNFVSNVPSMKSVNIYLNKQEKHILVNPVTINISVCIFGYSILNVIECYYQSSQFPEEQHSLYFNRSFSITLVNLIAQNCPLPIRIDTVQNVAIDNVVIR